MTPGRTVAMDNAYLGDQHLGQTTLFKVEERAGFLNPYSYREEKRWRGKEKNHIDKAQTTLSTIF
jgi:hypothetical protein